MNKFKHVFLGAAAASAALVAAAPAAAQTTFDGSISNITLHDTDPGLVVFASPIAFGPFSLTSIGDFYDAAVMTIGTSEGSVELFEDTVPYSISADFSFINPNGTAGGPITGSTSGFYQLFSSCGAIAGGCGQVNWGSPQLFSFGDGGQFSVQLFDASFHTPGTATVTGRFTLLANSVPEPATWAMLLIGFGAIGATMRTRKAVSGLRLKVA